MRHRRASPSLMRLATGQITAHSWAWLALSPIQMGTPMAGDYALAASPGWSATMDR